ncbi:hypothetical protein T190130A13A_40257 [Tenacibaculum sp. 190130A14a]|uniref:Uncharacterized protein n=1 Tax=Tenacibaculum polynesiense TaxID=3137857 RepID=A0ABP1F1R3_9FLAO
MLNWNFLFQKAIKTTYLTYKIRTKKGWFYTTLLYFNQKKVVLYLHDSF